MIFTFYIWTDTFGLEGVHFYHDVYALLTGNNLNNWDCIHDYKCHASFTLGYTLYYDIHFLHKFYIRV